MPAFRKALLFAVIVAVGPVFGAEPAVSLVEKFDEKNVCRVDVKSSISGTISVPVGEGQLPTVVTLVGQHHFEYDERALPSEDTAEKRLVRTYRTFEFDRTIGGQKQTAAIRPEVRRMVFLRSAEGKKAPFSPDGPLTFDEIDVLKNDLFTPTLVTGLLPADSVSPGTKWRASLSAVIDLTDLDKVEEGGLEVEYVGVITANGKKYAKLVIDGTISGSNEDGPSRQRIDGTAYFDLAASRLSYFKLNGVHELLGPDGKPTGKIEGTFTVNRDPSPKADEFTDAALKAVDLNPTDANTRLLYDNRELGLKFLHPRRWRVGVVQGRQVVLTEPQGGWAKMTVLPATLTPTAAAFQTEVKAFLAKEKVKLSPVPEPKRWKNQPPVDRFGIDVQAETGKLRMEFALLATPDGGVTVDARLPEKQAADLAPDLDTILKSLAVTKSIADK